MLIFCWNKCILIFIRKILKYLDRKLNIIYYKIKILDKKLKIMYYKIKILNRKLNMMDFKIKFFLEILWLKVFFWRNWVFKSYLLKEVLKGWLFVMV